MKGKGGGDRRKG
jgi:hypothetical protein